MVLHEKIVKNECEKKTLDKVDTSNENESVNGHPKGRGTASLECSQLKEAVVSLQACGFSPHP